MPTYTLDDGTTTITFSAFTEIVRTISTIDALHIAYPDYEGFEVIDIGRRVRVFTVKWRLQDIVSGDSAAKQRDDFEDLLLDGGANEGQFTLTFDREDSTVASPILQTYTVRVINNNQRMIPGDHVSELEGEMICWEDTIN